jgi:hypothetical protein
MDARWHEVSVKKPQWWNAMTGISGFIE